MRPIALIAAVGLAALVAGAADAGTVTFYASQKAFSAAEPGLPVQSFNGARLSGRPYATIANTLDSKTGNGVFAAGAILPGLVVRTQHPGALASALIVYGGGPVDAISVGNNWFGDTLVLNFPSGVAAVGETVFGATSSGTSLAGRIHEAVYSGKTLIGARTYAEATGGRRFIGVISPSLAITSVQITWVSAGDATTYVSTIAFGAASAARKAPR